jgi:hypothetical protein
MNNFAPTKNIGLCLHIDARVAELVDALVSNTSDSNIVPVRSRPRVHIKFRLSALQGAFFMRPFDTENFLLEKY